MQKRLHLIILILPLLSHSTHRSFTESRPATHWIPAFVGMTMRLQLYELMRVLNSTIVCALGVPCCENRVHRVLPVRTLGVRPTFSYT